MELQFECLGSNTKKYKAFSDLIEKEFQTTDKDGNENVVTISYKIKLIDSARFMASSLSNLVNNVHYQILLIISQKELTR